MYNHPQTIIVYRSRAEQERDEFLQEHPEILMGVLGVILLVVVVGVGQGIYRSWRANRFFKQKKIDWEKLGL